MKAVVFYTPLRSTRTRSRFAMPAGPSLVVGSAHLMTCAKADLMFNRLPVNRHGEFCHWARPRRAYIIVTKLRDRDGNGLVQAFCIDINAVRDTIRIGEGDPPAGTSHRLDSSPYRKRRSV